MKQQQQNAGLAVQRSRVRPMIDLSRGQTQIETLVRSLALRLQGLITGNHLVNWVRTQGAEIMTYLECQVQPTHKA
jgi:hypothetical protein